MINIHDIVNTKLTKLLIDNNSSDMDMNKLIKYQLISGMFSNGKVDIVDALNIKLMNKLTEGELTLTKLLMIQSMSNNGGHINLKDIINIKLATKLLGDDLDSLFDDSEVSRQSIRKELDDLINDHSDVT